MIQWWRVRNWFRETEERLAGFLDGVFIIGLFVLVVVAFVGCMGQLNPDIFQAPNPGYDQSQGTPEVWP